jgi:methylphosphotriester-DNA--protein-cysteine methyltransferase
MRVHIHRPRPPLDAFVENVTWFEDYRPAHKREKLIPDGAVEIIVDLTDRPKKLYDRDDLRRSRDFHDAWISGLRSRWIVVEAQQGSSLVIIRFWPCGAAPFLRMPADELTDHVVPLTDVFGSEASFLREMLLEADTIGARMEAVERWLLRRGGSHLEQPALADFLSRRLSAPGNQTIAELAESVGYTERHVRSLVKQTIGASPKRYARIRRFQRVLSHLKHDTPPSEADLMLLSGPLPEPDWADVAQAHQYFDQSHLARDFREFAGMTPGAYVATYRGLENYLPFD